VLCLVNSAVAKLENCGSEYLMGLFCTTDVLTTKKSVHLVTLYGE
jgi:hypothetical protein